MARVAPIFSLKPTLKQDGTTVVFTAEVEAVPKPTAAWFRGETKVEASDRAKARLEQVGKSSKYKVLLTITNASVDDSGVYKVEVKNSLGKKSATINLDLKGGENLGNQARQHRNRKLEIYSVNKMHSRGNPSLLTGARSKEIDRQKITIDAGRQSESTKVFLSFSFPPE